MYILLLIMAYLFGAIPFGLIFGKVFKGMDIREYGSGNVGSTNAARVLGYKIGLMTLFCDVLKGFLFVYLSTKIGLSYLQTVTIGAASIIGHSYSIYLGFKGGKAVATSLGVFLMLAPKAILLCAIVFFTIFILTGYVSLASILSSIFLPIFIYLMYNIKEYVIFAIIISFIIVIRHKSNIYNLINKKEDSFFDKAKKK